MFVNRNIVFWILGYNRRTVAPYNPVLAQNIARRQGGPVLVRSNTRTQSSYSIDQLHLRGSGTATQTSIQQQISTSGTVSQIGQGFGRVQLGVPGGSIQTGHVIARQNLGVGGTAVQASYNLQQQGDGGNIGTLGMAPGRRRGNFWLITFEHCWERMGVEGFGFNAIFNIGFNW